MAYATTYYGRRSVTVEFQDQVLVEYDDKVKEVKNMLITTISTEDSIMGLRLVDAVLRLGLEYHFQEEINAILLREYDIFCSENNDRQVHDLYKVSLQFRLLRQGGYAVSSDVLKKFKDGTGNFSNLLEDDKDGVMELFEASQLSLEGEHILEEAEDFCRRQLSKWSNCTEDNQARKNILYSLKQPYHKSAVRLTAANFLKSHDGKNNEEYSMILLKELARKDIKILQSIHQKEISIISEWWNVLGLAKELKFARDQPLKWYLWTVVAFSDPSLSEQRIELTKPIALVYIIDDIFDIHGTLDELSLFTEVVEKWDIKAAERLPDYLKICFKALHGITKNISHKVFSKCSWDPTYSLRKAWGKLCDAFLVEARWFRSGKLPGEEEYLNNAIMSSGAHVVLAHAFFLLGQGITEDTVSLIDQVPILISSTATILRLWDDLGNATDEDQNGHDGSYVDCYVKRREGCSVEETREHVRNMIKTEWKILNEENLYSNDFPSSFKRACLNAARMIPLMYDYDENQRLPGLEHYFKSLLS